jgi:hypothetical protein
MAKAETYKLRLYAELAQKDGGRVRLEIYGKYPRTSVVTAEEIGDVVQGLTLDIQGLSEDIDTPIVKTSLVLSLVDAPELNTETMKCGNWELFYTPDATKWKVVLKGKSKGDMDYRTLWGGYITPDSYVETLCHHGVVTVTARDNIGMLKEKDFDGVGNADGVITPYELINQAWAKTESPMVLDWRGEEDENEWPRSDGVDVIYTYINLSAFAEKSWYDAIYDVLYSIGGCMRYVGNNKVAICPIRRLPNQGRVMSNLPVVTPVFQAYATRELTPAVKRIEESIDYSFEEGKEVPLVGASDFSGDEYSVPVTLYNVFGEETRTTAQVMSLQNFSDTSWSDNDNSSTIYFNTGRFEIRETEEKKKTIAEQMFLELNADNNRVAWYGLQMSRLLRITFRLEQGEFIKLVNGGHIESSFAGEIGKSLGESVIMRVAVKLTANDQEYWWSKGWYQNYQELTFTFDDEGILEMPLSFLTLGSDVREQGGLLQIFITSVKYKVHSKQPIYMGLKAVSINVENTNQLVESNTVRTVYDEKNNINMVRDPALGPAFDQVAFPGFITNAIFRNNAGIYEPTPDWLWYGEEDPLPLPAQIHRQLLMYHSKPNNLITGDIMNADLTRIPTLWRWRGADHILLSGQYNFCNGRIEGAHLREFVRYEDLW